LAFSTALAADCIAYLAWLILPHGRPATFATTRLEQIFGRVELLFNRSEREF
jgi:hypothetical protein